MQSIALMPLACGLAGVRSQYQRIVLRLITSNSALSRLGHTSEGQGRYWYAMSVRETTSTCMNTMGDGLVDVASKPHMSQNE
jgi:hypothetical protein